MAKSTEITMKQKKQVLTKLDYFMDTYLLPKEDKFLLGEMKSRWGLHDRDVSEINRFPIFKYEDIKDGKKIVETKIVTKRMTPAVLFEIIVGDPTSILKDKAETLKDVVKVGGYTQWLVNQYLKIVPDDFQGYKDDRWSQQKESVRRFFEDMYRVKEDLQKFNRFKKRLPETKHDIGQIKDGDELYDLVKDFSLEEAIFTKVEVKKRVLMKEAKLMYEDNRYEIITPLTGLASHELAGPPLTRWCTASTNYSNMHDSYSRQGPLYIIRDKNKIIPSGKGAGDPKPIYQFHFETSQYMDTDDRRMDIVQYLNEKGNEGMKEFFRPNFLNAFRNREFDPNDGTFKNYVTLFGANEKLTETILKFLEKKIQATDEIVVMDDNKDYSGYIDMLKHEPFFSHILNFAKPSTRVFEITFKKYNGSGIDVPATLGKLVNVTNMVMSGFVRTLPKEIGNLKKLELTAFSENPHFKGFPEEFGSISTLQVTNAIKSNLTMKDLPKKLQAAHEKGDILIVLQ